MAAEPVEEKQCRQHRPPIKAPAKVNKDGKAVGEQHEKPQSVDHGIAEHACPQEPLQQLSPQQHGRKAVQQKVQHEARLPCQHREKPHILRAGIFIDRKVIAEKIQEKRQHRREHPIAVIPSGGLIHIPVFTDPHIPIEQQKTDDIYRKVGPRRQQRRERQQHRQGIIPPPGRSRVDPLQHEEMKVKERKSQKMRIAGAVQEHLPLIEAEKHKVYQHHQQGVQPLPQHVFPQHEAAEEEPQHAQHPVEGHGIAEELTVQKAQEVG